MKNLLVIAATLTVFSFTAYSEEQTPQEAPEEYVLSLLSTCQEYAQEDEVAEKDMTAYLLSCINDELVASDYLPIKKLPTA
ncbi:hypothetical protein [Thalassotalea ganghwensis]